MPAPLFFEGVDGAGKSTLAAAAVGGSGLLLESPPEPFRPVRHQVAAQAAPYARLYYFLAANLHTATVASCEARSRPVAVVRHVWSTVAYFSAQQGVPVEDVLRVLGPISGDLLLESKVVYLTVSPSEQLERLRSRDSENALQRSLAEQRNFQEQVRNAFSRVFHLLCSDVLVLDTTDAPVPQLAAAVRAHWA